MGDFGLDFEFFLRSELPNLLRLSPSKKYAMDVYFCKFADEVRNMYRIAPKEVSLFYSELKSRINAVSKFRASRGENNQVKQRSIPERTTGK